MKPRTKLHFRVTALSAKLPKLTDKQKEWAFQHCLMHWGYRNKTNTSCLECGHIWPTRDNRYLLVSLCEPTYICPGCAAKLTIEDTRVKKVSQREYLGLVTICKEFQVNRFFEVRSFHRAGEKRRCYVQEVVQQWLQPDGKNEAIAMNRGSMGSYSNHFHGDLEIRDKNYLPNKFNVYPTAILPRAKCLPIYKRNGLKGKFGDVSPYDMFTTILTDSKAETLLKANQFGLLAARTGGRNQDIDRYWNSIKICMRNKYTVKNGITWLDYMQLLRHFGKDLNNSKYVCPRNLKLEHDRLVSKKLAIKNAKQQEERKKQAIKDRPIYEKAKKGFFGIMFSSGDITIKVLENIQEFIAESDAHHHCVFTNKYYNKPDSLILSAKVKGKPVETIEISLSSMKVVQSRGLQNKVTEYNKQILKIMNENMSVIKKRYKELHISAA